MTVFLLLVPEAADGAADATSSSLQAVCIAAATGAPGVLDPGVTELQDYPGFEPY